MESEALGAAQSATDFSFIALFFRADPIVKAVMGILVAASVWSWAIIIDKSMRFSGLGRMKSDLERDRRQTLKTGMTIEQLQALASRHEHVFGEIYDSASAEWQQTREAGRGVRDAYSGQSLVERMETTMRLAGQSKLADAESGLGILASIGSSAPFIGLFGTVWGIMNSFQAIAASRDTNLAVVAPGIAEALFATALGLFAAVPAVLFYNKFATDVARFAGTLEMYTDALATNLSRKAQERSA